MEKFSLSKINLFFNDPHSKNLYIALVLKATNEFASKVSMLLLFSVCLWMLCCQSCILVLSILTLHKGQDLDCSSRHWKIIYALQAFDSFLSLNLQLQDLLAWTKIILYFFPPILLKPNINKFLPCPLTLWKS